MIIALFLLALILGFSPLMIWYGSRSKVNASASYFMFGMSLCALSILYSPFKLALCAVGILGASCLGDGWGELMAFLGTALFALVVVVAVSLVSVFARVPMESAKDAEG